MVDDGRGSTPIFPLAVVGAAVIALLIGVFVWVGEEPPDEATIAADDDLEARPSGAGTTPEGAVDRATDGISDELDDVEPAAPDEDTIPPAENAPESLQEQSEGNENSPGDPALDPSSEDVTGNSNSSEMNSGPMDGEAEETADDAATVEESEGAPSGRDAQTDLTPEADQEIVADDNEDDEGTAFVPTPSGPEGRDDGTILDE